MKTAHLRRTLVLIGFGVTASLFGCIYSFYQSVHFYDNAWTDQETIDFGRVADPVMISGWNLEPQRAGSVYHNGIPQFPSFSDEALAELKPPRDPYDYWPDPSDDFRRAIHKGRNQEVRGDFRGALATYAKFGQAQRIQSFIRDRQELLDAGLSFRSKGFSSYLRARYLLEFGGTVAKSKAKSALSHMVGDSRLMPHVAYALASTLDPDTPQQRAEAFLKMAAKYPNSARAEPALVMAGRTYLEYIRGSSHEAWEWKEGIRILDRLRVRYPRTRFLGAVFGWRGAYELKRNDVAKAIEFYIKQSNLSNPQESWKGHQALAEIAAADGRLASAAVHWLKQRELPVDVHFKYSAAKQLRDKLAEFKEGDLKKIQDRIQGDPALLYAYLNFRLEDTPLPPEQERPLISYITTCIGRANSVDPGIYSRLAQLQYNAGLYDQAVATARKVSRGTSDAQLRCRYVEAASLVRLGKPKAAIKIYERLYWQKLPEAFHNAVSENFALLSEKYGDPRRSFMIYREMDYDNDVGYLADCVLSTDQFKSLLPWVKSQKDKNAYMYALAMRYLRKGQYRSARSTLLSIPKRARVQGGLLGADYADYRNTIYFDKLPTVTDPLIHVNAMETLRNRATHAQTREGRASALYSLAQYVRKHRNLLFYAPGLWNGGRSSAYGLRWNPEINKGRDNELVVKRNVEQECEGQVMLICEELLRKFPKSKLAPKALYTAATASVRLTSLNSFWRERKTPYVTKAIKYLDRLTRDYPNDPLVPSAKKYAEVFREELSPEYSN